MSQLMKHLIYFIFNGVLFLATSNTLFAGTIIGRVTEKQTGSIAVGVNVRVEGTVRGASTDQQGRFRIENIPEGRQRVTVSAIGYVKQTEYVTIESVDSAVVDFSLTIDLVALGEVTTTGHKSFSAASSEDLRAMDFELRPRQSAQDMLRLVPGLVIAQHAGGGKAEQIYVRGFDADHGTDINLSVDGVPVNMVSHGHGQGYADLHFVIPEVVSGLEVYKGPYFAQYGDLATAGSVRLQTRKSLDYNVVSVEGGEFGTYRGLGMVQLPIESNSTTSYLAGELFHSDGYFDTKVDLNRYNVFGKLASRISENGKLDVWVSGFHSRWNATGQVPSRAVAENLIDRFGSIDPTEGGNTNRYNANISYSAFLKNNSTFSAQAYVSKYQFQLYSNFTFFARDTVNGDGIEQVDDRIVYGARAEFSQDHTLGSIAATGLLGSSFRADDIDVQLFHQAQRRRLSTTSDAIIYQKNLSFYAQEELRFNEVARLQLGLRTDVFFFDVTDRITDPDHLTVSGSATLAVVTPKANLVISPSSKLDLFVNAGGGFHSNDARAVASNKSERTLPRAWGAEIGVKLRAFDNWTLSVAGWRLDLQNELVYVGDEGTTELSGPTRRVGIDLEVRAQLLEWLYADADVTLSRGRFRDLPEGKNFIPLAPTFTSSAGLNVRHSSGIESSFRLRQVSSRPANETNSVRALGYAVFDAVLAYSFQNYRVQLGLENLFNTKWNETQFDTESRLRNEAAPVSELHFTPGTPFNARMKVEYSF